MIRTNRAAVGLRCLAALTAAALAVGVLIPSAGLPAEAATGTSVRIARVVTPVGTVDGKPNCEVRFVQKKKVVARTPCGWFSGNPVRVRPGRYRIQIAANYGKNRDSHNPLHGGWVRLVDGKAQLVDRSRATIVRISGTSMTLPTVTLVPTQGFIAGTVRDTAGRPLKPQYRYDLSARAAGALDTVWDGAFALARLKTGRYRVAINRDSGPSLYIGGYYVGKGRKVTPDPAKATRVKVTAGTATTGIDAVLPRCASVSGRVYGTSEFPSTVVVFNDADRRVVTRSSFLSDDGRFTVTGLSPGRYYVAVNYNRGTYELTDGWDVFHGTDSTTRPSTPTVVVSSCTQVRGVVIDGRKQFANTERPLLEGLSGHVGDDISLVAGGWTGDVVSLTHVWLRDGKTIEVKGTDYTLTKADIGHRLTVRETARTRDGRTLTVTSKAFRVSVPNWNFMCGTFSYPHWYD